MRDTNWVRRERPGDRKQSPSEPSVEDCLQELREMFPEIEVARYDLLYHRLELHLPDQWIKYFSGTLREAMSQVRAWHKEQNAGHQTD